FVAAAAGALLLRRERERVAEDDEAVLSPRVEIPERRERSGADSRGETLLGRLPEAARARLLASADSVTVAAGEWLFHAGGRADAVYVVEAGRLQVVADEAVLNEVGPGEVVGALAVLADATRSAGIRARRDSRLLRISAGEFQAALDVDPAAERAVRTALALQLQQSRRLEEAAPSEPRIVSVVGGGADRVSSLLVESLARHLKVVAPGRVTIDMLDRAERDAERVVLCATPDDDARWHEFCVRQADRVVLVAGSDERPPARVFDAPSYVVLVGPPPAREALLAWYDAVAPRRVHTCSAGDLGAAIAPLAARLAGRSLGVALAGGGARAFASIGVFHELEENGIAVDRVSGCSVGGIIASLYAAGKSAAAVDAACYDEFVRRSPFGDLTLPRVSLSRGRRA